MFTATAGQFTNALYGANSAAADKDTMALYRQHLQPAAHNASVPAGLANLAGNQALDGLKNLSVGALRAVTGNIDVEALKNLPAAIAQSVRGAGESLGGALAAKTPEGSELLTQLYGRSDASTTAAIVAATPAALLVTPVPLVGRAGGAGGGKVTNAAKNSLDEFVPGQNGGTAKSTAKAPIDGIFDTQGLNIDPMRLADGVKMVRELEKTGLTHKEAVDQARGFISAGSTPPVAKPLDATDSLVKVVPSGGAPSSSTGYWMSKSEFETLSKDPVAMSSKLGLPPKQQVESFDVFEIKPRQGALVFESAVAPTTVNGKPDMSGGAKQTIVVDRNQFTPPVKTGSISIK